MKKIVIVILIVATILNTIAGAFIFLDIQTLDFPVSTFTLHLDDLKKDDAQLQATLEVNNTNDFSLSIQDLTITTMTETGDIIAQFTLQGGNVPSHQTTTFSTTTLVQFNNTLPKTLTSKITGTVGVLFFGLVKKTLPLKLSMVTDIATLTTQFTLPDIHLEGNFSSLTQEGVNFTSSVGITNPYTFDLEIENLTVNIQTETGTNVGTITLPRATIPAETSGQLNGSGRLLLNALNAQTLHMRLQGDIVILVAGAKKTLNLSIDAQMNPPKIEQLLSDSPTDASLTGHFRLTLEGLLDHITFTVVNPNKIKFLATNVTVQIYRVDRNKTRLICNGTLANGTIAPQSTSTLEGDMIIPYTHLLPQVGERLFADQLQVVMRANFTIPGVNQTIWIGMIGYQDFPFHRLLS
jgi:LEA14-like dessication related protein